MTLDYTKLTGPIVRGGRWPPADGYMRAILTRTQDDVALNWPVGADGWAWSLRISRSQLGLVPDLILTASVVNLLTNVITLYFYATEAQTLTLPNTNKVRYWAQVRSVGPGAMDSFYGTGRAFVESSVGEG